jgi:hypothetical protein
MLWYNARHKTPLREVVFLKTPPGRPKLRAVFFIKGGIILSNLMRIVKGNSPKGNSPDTRRATPL